MDLSAPKGHPRLGWGSHLGAVEPPLRLLGTHPGSILSLLCGFCDPCRVVGSPRGTGEQWGHSGAAGTPRRRGDPQWAVGNPQGQWGPSKAASPQTSPEPRHHHDPLRKTWPGWWWQWVGVPPHHSVGLLT